MSKANLDVPILLIFFKREEETLACLDSIRSVKPRKIYLAGDGPRNSKSEAVAVLGLRKKVVSGIDWECEVMTLFQEDNLGCGPGVYTAMKWFFENEEMGIILEDDCIPLPSFYVFCKILLDRYRNDSRIAQIAGFNPLKKSFSNDSYYYSKYVENWGWATWRRAWNQMDMEMNWLKSPLHDDIIKNTGYLAKDLSYWKHHIKDILTHKISAWDIQWCFSVASQNQMTIYPKYNLIKNIGHGEGATHTTVANPLINFEVGKELEFPLKHPEYMLPNFKFDEAIYGIKNHPLAKLARHLPNSIKLRGKQLMKIFRG